MRPDDTSRRRFLGGVGLVLSGVSGCLTTASDRGPAGLQGNSTDQPTASITPTESPTATATSTATETATPPDTGGPEWWTPRGSVLDSFDGFETAWTVGGGTAAVSDELAFDDGQSVALDSDGDTRLRIERRFSDPRDFTDAEFSMAVRLEETTKPLVQVNLVLIDGTGEQRTLSGSILPEATDRWVRFDLGVRRDTGATMGSIKGLRIDHWVGDDETRLYVDDLRVHPKPDIGHVIFSFDDKGTTDYSVAFRVLEEYGYSGVCFPPIGRVTDESTPSVADYREMIDHGWDIGGHTLDHEDLTKHTRSEQRTIIEENFRLLREKGLAGPSNHFRTPYSNYDSNSLDLMTESFDTSVIGVGSATGTNVHVTDHRTLGFKSGDELQTAKAGVDAAVTYRQLFGITLHMANIDGAHLHSLAEHVRRHERAGRLRVLTLSELYEEFIRP